MVDYSEVRNLPPSISFFLARLGAFLESSSGHFRQVELFASRDSVLRSILSNLYPFVTSILELVQSLREMLVEERVGSEIRSSELEMGLSSSDNSVEVILPPRCPHSHNLLQKPQKQN